MSKGLSPKEALSKLLETKNPSKGDFDSIILLIKNGELDINTQQKPSDPTILIKLVMCSGDFEEHIAELITLHADLKTTYVPTFNDLPLAASPSLLPQTALAIAAAYGNSKCLKKLLHATSNIEPAQFRFAITFAHKNKHQDCVYVLIAYKAWLSQDLELKRRKDVREIDTINPLIKALKDDGVAGLTTFLSGDRKIALETINETLIKLQDVKLDYDWYMERFVFDLDINAMFKPLEEYREQHYPILKPKRIGFLAFFSCFSKPSAAEEDESTLVTGNAEFYTSRSPQP